jgi:hypothetical protein
MWTFCLSMPVVMLVSTMATGMDRPKQWLTTGVYESVDDGDGHWRTMQRA